VISYLDALTSSKGVLWTSPSPKGRAESYAGISATSPLSFKERGMGVRL